METASNSTLRKSQAHPLLGEPQEHVVVRNYGWYLFNRIPLACGDADDSEDASFVMFTDHMRPEILHDKLTRYAAKRNEDIRELTFTCDESVFFEVPGLGVPIPIPYVLCYHEIQFSGVLCKRDKLQPTNDGKAIRKEARK